jgi:hypothetical protein
MVLHGRIFSRRTSVAVYGGSRPLLNWVVYALASTAKPGLIWTDVRLRGEVLADIDPLSRDLIPPDRLNVVDPEDFVPDDATANLAIAGVVRDDEPPSNLRRIVDFLRLPPLAQRVLSNALSGDLPIVLILSNADHLSEFYPRETVAPIIRTVVEANAIVFLTYAHAPPRVRDAFETILHVEGTDLTEWREAKLRVDQGPSDGPLRAGSEYRLGELGSVAAVLARDLK